MPESWCGGFADPNERRFTERLIDEYFDVRSEDARHDVEDLRMPGVFLEKFVVLRQVPDLPHIVEPHGVGGCLAFRHVRFDLHVVLRECDHLVADVLQTQVERLDLERRQNIVDRDEPVCIVTFRQRFRHRHFDDPLPIRRVSGIDIWRYESGSRRLATPARIIEVRGTIRIKYTLRDARMYPGNAR